MKIGYWTYVYNTKINEIKTLLNYGDYFQCTPAENLVKNITMPSQDIISLTPNNFFDACSENLILPLQWNIFDQTWLKGNNLNIPSNIRMIFLASKIKPTDKKYLTPYNIDILKKMAPFGCRDMYTLNILRNLGIEAYFTGCITATLPKRSDGIAKKADKIMFIDAPSSLKKYVPKELLENAEFFSQQDYIDSDEDLEKIKQMIEERYEYYFNNAKIIVTSRMHAALPAIAKGIPVIFAKEIIDNRLSILSQFTPLYSKEEFQNISWNPQPIECEELKKLLLNGYIELLENKAQKRDNLKKVSKIYEDCYENFTECEHYTNVLHNNFSQALNYLSEKYLPEDVFEYNIWGLSSATQNFYQLMNHTYKNARLKFVIDSYKSGFFENIEILIPQQVDFKVLNNIFVLPVGACNFANQYFAELGIDENSYCLCAELYMTV